MFSQLQTDSAADTNSVYFSMGLSGSTVYTYFGEKNVGSTWGGRDGNEVKTTDDQLVLVSWVTVTW